MKQGIWNFSSEEEEEEKNIEEKIDIQTKKYGECGLNSNIVEAIVIRITKKEILCDIIKIGNHKQEILCRGIIRDIDTANVSVYKLPLLNCVRPGDLVKCKIIARGVNKSYLLSMKDDDLGVVVANCDCCKIPMRPISNIHMICDNTKNIVLKKVAVKI